MKITSETMVPIGWVFGGVSFVLGIAFASAMWVASVDNRLSRIEQHLGISPYAGVSVFDEAKANQK